MNETFKAKEVIRITGLPKTKLDQWIYRGIITPRSVAKGSGYHTEYDKFDIFFILLIKRLVKVGVQLKHVSSIIKKAFPPPLVDDLMMRFLYVNSDGEVETRRYLIEGEDVDLSQLKTGIIINPKEIWTEVDEKIKDSK